MLNKYVMYVLALSDYKHSAAAAGYKPAPQLGRERVTFCNIGKPQ